jgi:hypothetical protein
MRLFSTRKTIHLKTVQLANSFERKDSKPVRKYNNEIPFLNVAVLVDIY